MIDYYCQHYYDKTYTLNMYLESRYSECILEACSLGLHSQFGTVEFRISQF